MKKYFAPLAVLSVALLSCYTAVLAAPTAPTGITATPGNKSVVLNWSAVTGAKKYKIKRGTAPNKSFSDVGSVNAPTVSYNDTSVKNGTTYYYVLSTVDTASKESPNSTPAVSATPNLPAPSGLAATASSRSVKLTWNAVSGVSKYKVRRATVTGGPYTDVASPTSNSYTDGGLVNGTTYYYVVLATDGSGVSGNSNETNATPALVAPSGLSASATSRTVSLSWTPVDGIQKYSVSRALVTGGPYTKIGTSTVPAYSDANLTNNVQYFYVVNALDGDLTSANSNEASATPTLAKPAGVAAVAASRQVQLSWTGVPGAKKYNIMRAEVTGGPYVKVTDTTSTSFTDGGLTNGTTYYYVIVAVDGDQLSPQSDEASATPILLKPTNVVATPSSKKVVLTWNSVVGAKKYSVQRSETTGGPYTEVGLSGTTSYTDKDLVNNVTYYYVVVAVDGVEQSVPSDEASGTPFLMPPTNVSATAGSAQVVLNWTAATDADSYRVKRSTTSGGSLGDPYVTVGSPTGTTFTDTGVVNGTTYYYVVISADGSERSAASSEVIGNPTLKAPTNLEAKSGNLEISLDWDIVDGADGYKVKRSDSTGGPYQGVGTVTGTEFIDETVIAGKTYYYIVVALEGNEQSPNSNEDSAAAQLLPPSNIKTTGGNQQVTITWDAVTNADSYKIKRSDSVNGTYKDAGSSATPTFTNTGLKNGKTYYFIVTTVDGGQQSANSAAVAGTPVLPAPKNLVADPGNKVVDLDWDVVTGATGYIVLRSTTSGSNYKNIGTTSKISYSDKSVSNGTTYYYVVEATLDSDKSANSNEASAKPLSTLAIASVEAPDAPGSLTAFSSGRSIGLQWAASAGATKYIVKRSSVSGGPYEQIGTTKAREYTDTSTAPNTTYYYVVTAVGDAESANSNEAGATSGR